MAPIMSFWPSVYNRIKSKNKFFEYRRSFPKDCTFAYMYVSKPIKSIRGLVHFGNKYTLDEMKDIFSNNKMMLEQINSSPTTYKYALEIVGFQEIQPITLQELRENIPNFRPPQSYLILENNLPLKYYIEDNIRLTGNKISIKNNSSENVT